MIGIPYAKHARLSNDAVDPSAVICPICNKKINLIVAKDSESYSINPYSVHYEIEHTMKDSK